MSFDTAPRAATSHARTLANVRAVAKSCRLKLWFEIVEGANDVAPLRLVNASRPSWPSSPSFSIYCSICSQQI